ncbi:NUDIX domain-containing protein [Candidatus Woesearchaeota archaeon]|nr:NUDIX domain-containing protein [Candidatus Woesearchaeota archaeon]
MAREISAGIVVFRKEKNNNLYLLLHKEPQGIYKESWDFPKGWIEEGEEDLEAALRETKEETGIKDLRIIEGFREGINFFFKKGNEPVNKTVKYFLGITETKKVKVSFEHAGSSWLNYEDALKKITSKGSKEVLKKANDFINKGVSFNESLKSFTKNKRK